MHRFKPKRLLPGQPPSLTQQLVFVAELLCASLLHFGGSSLVYFSLKGGFGCYQVGADQYQTHACLVNRQLAAHQAALSVRWGRAERSQVVTLIPPHRFLTASANRPFKHSHLYLYFICDILSLLCAHVFVCNVSKCMVCVCVRAYVWLGCLYCSLLTWIPFSPSQDSAGAGLSF